MTYTIQSMIDAITALIQQHPENSQWIIFGIAFVESMAILGSIFPGTLLLTPIGIMLGSGVLPLLETLLSIVVGAFVGDSLSYMIGIYYHTRVESLSWVKKHQASYHWFKEFLEKYGILSLVIGRFVGPLRSSVPLFAGLLGMSYTTYLFGIVPSIILWSIAYLSPGFIIGSPVVSHYLQTILFSFSIQHHLAFISVISIVIISYFLPKKSEMMKKANLLIQLTAVFITLLTTLDLKLWTQLDQWSQHYLQELFPHSLSYWVSTICDATIVIPACAIMIISNYLYSCIKKRCIHRPHQHIALTSLLILLFLSVPFIKINMSQTRPIPLLSHLSAAFNSANQYSFPSGHTTLLSALIIFMGFFLSELTRRQKIAYWLSACLIYSMTILSRLSLSEHWVSDIVGGSLLGSMLALLAYIIHCLYQSDERLSCAQATSLSLCIIVIGSIRYLYYG